MREDGEENPARPAATPPAGSSREPAAPAAAAPEPGPPQGQFPAGEAPEAEEAEAGFPGPGLPDPGFPELDFSDAGLPEPDVPDPEDVAEPEDLGGWEEFRRPGESAGPLAPAEQRDPAPARQADSLPADSASADSPRPAAPAPTDAPAGPELTAIAPAEGLSAQDTAVLALESRGGRMRGGAKERVIREQLEMSPTRYYQLLNALLDDPAALRHAPVTVNRLRRVRDDRRAQR
ncbi:DUF3263 domain-containing protein [Streptomyces bohaiensis]|uniref:DUF3263 domain-containing protein n=1 Tax=Streptomyces bohaiensis TaxID=1431344 RepID=UPI003B7C88E3